MFTVPAIVTIPVALNAAVDMLPPVILPMADINPPVNKFPLVTLPVTLTNPPVWLAASTIVVARTLLAAILPDILKLPPVTLPVADTLPVTLSPKACLNLPISLAVSLPLVLNTMSLAV